MVDIVLQNKDLKSISCCMEYGFPHLKTNPKMQTKRGLPSLCGVLGAILVIAVVTVLLASFRREKEVLSPHIPDPKSLRRTTAKSIRSDQSSASFSQNTSNSHDTREIDHILRYHDISFDGIDDTVTAIVSCNTTRGELTIDVRAAWAPLGSEQFLFLVDEGLFTNLPFTRVCPKYITQFGAKYKGFKPKSKPLKVIADDKSLWGIRDMAYGYVFFAGNGPNSRRSEMVIALCESKGCKVSGLGHADWEVPVATIRKEGFETLNMIASSGFPYPRLEMIGQHPKAGGPDAGKIFSEPDYLKREYPFMEYFRECRVVNRNIHIIRPLTEDHPEMDLWRGSNRTVDDNRRTSYIVKLTLATTLGQGEVIVEIMHGWAPLGAQRFRELVEEKFFDGVKFFRVIKVDQSLLLP